VGTDTVIGAYPQARLACPHDEAMAPSRPPRHRLGYDMVLASRSEASATSIGPTTRVGIDTVLL
jgi:hypothetical protein